VEKNEVEIVEDLEGEVEVVKDVVKEIVPALEVRTMDFTLTSYQSKVTVNGIAQESVKLAVSNTKIMQEK
jgi:ribosomal protein S7